MTQTVYVRILGEGTLVYRPVPAISMTSNVYLLSGDDAYDPEDEDWEYIPGDMVFVDTKELEGSEVLVAVGRAS